LERHTNTGFYSAFEKLLKTMHRARHVSIILLFLSIAIHVDAQERSILPDKVKNIESQIRAAISEADIPGLSIAVVRDNQIRYANGFGKADLEGSIPARPGTVYRLGSLSKTITATAVMRLAEQGKLNLDTSIQKYCPAFPPKPWPITARQLLAHLGGVRDYSSQKFLDEYFSTRHYDSVTESLDIFKDDPLLQEPGAKYSYSTYGYTLLGCAVEGASSMTYENYIGENILKPAGMTRTGVDDVFRIIPNRARGYGKTREGILRNTAFTDTSNKVPGGGLLSTVEDMARFYIALQGGKLVSQETLNQMWTLQKTRDGKQITYGLGWRVGDRNGLTEVYHGGNAAGFSTFFYMLPKRNVAVVIMANKELIAQKQRDDLARQITDIVIR
jgi:serine beta-lactamase-like protein LACTB